MVIYFFIQHDRDWENIANFISGANGRNCMFKWLSLKKINVMQNEWPME